MINYAMFVILCMYCVYNKSTVYPSRGDTTGLLCFRVGARVGRWWQQRRAGTGWHGPMALCCESPQLPPTTIAAFVPGCEALGVHGQKLESRWNVGGSFCAAGDERNLSEDCTSFLWCNPKRRCMNMLMFNCFMLFSWCFFRAPRVGYVFHRF